MPVKLATRLDMLLYLKRHGRVAELGVFKGEFSAHILNLSQPTHFAMIDTWSGREISGDKDGKNIVEVADMSVEGDRLFALYWHDDRVVVHRSTTQSALNEYPDSYFDWVYIDADHRYEAVKADLELSAKKANVIAGHDYCDAFPGAMRAVDEFCRTRGWHMAVITGDGCPSYVLERG